MITYRKDGTIVSSDSPPGLLLLSAINAVFTICVLAAWAEVAPYLSAPMTWATWRPIWTPSDLQSYFRYPYTLLWLLPAAAVLFARVAFQEGRIRLAYFCASTPPVLIGTIVAGYHYLP